MNYKVGDKVRIRKDLKCGFRGYDKVGVTCEMEAMSGQEVHIEAKETSKLDGITRYKFKEDNWCRYWTDDMFEKNKRHQPIIIYQKDDTTVVALDKETSAECLAICSKNDKFDFVAGADIAFTRLKYRLAENARGKEPHTIEEKRDWLTRYCCGRCCSDCVLDKCGCGITFTPVNDKYSAMSDAVVSLAYALVKATEGK